MTKYEWQLTDECSRPRDAMEFGEACTLLAVEFAREGGDVRQARVGSFFADDEDMVIVYITDEHTEKQVRDIVREDLRKDGLPELDDDGFPS